MNDAESITAEPRNSELLARHLDDAGIPYHLLNAKPENAAREADT